MSRRRKASVCSLRPVGSNHWLHAADAYVRQEIPRAMADRSLFGRLASTMALESRMRDVLWDSDKTIMAALKRLCEATTDDATFCRAARLFLRTWDKFHAQQLAALKDAADVIDFATARARLLAAGWSRPVPAVDLVTASERRARLAQCDRIESRASR